MLFWNERHIRSLENCLQAKIKSCAESYKYEGKNRYSIIMLDMFLTVWKIGICNITDENSFKKYCESMIR